MVVVHLSLSEGSIVETFGKILLCGKRDVWLTHTNDAVARETSECRRNASKSSETTAAVRGTDIWGAARGGPPELAGSGRGVRGLPLPLSFRRTRRGSGPSGVGTSRSLVAGKRPCVAVPCLAFAYAFASGSGSRSGAGVVVPSPAFAFPFGSCRTPEATATNATNTGTVGGPSCRGLCCCRRCLSCLQCL